MVADRLAVLTYAVRARPVLRYCGQLALVLATLTAVPLAVCALSGEWTVAGRYALVVAGLLAFGASTAAIRAPAHVQVNEALTVIVIAFAAAGLLGAWPLAAAGIRFSDALFESVSAVTTTGLSTLGDVEAQGRAFQFARAWMQWCGGLGIAVFSVALLMGHPSVARLLAEPALEGETFSSTARTHARRSLLVYALLTVFGIAILWTMTGDGFTALVHTLAAVSTGGFSSLDASVAGLGSRAAAAAAVALGALGAVAMHLYWRSAHAGVRGWLKVLAADGELRALLALFLLLGLALGWLRWLQGAEAPWYHGFVMGISAQSTTGFASMPVQGMDGASKLVMIFAMLVGGSAGSTAGGFKLLRLLIVLRLLQLTLGRTGMPPDAVAEPYLGGRRLEPEDAIRALVLVLAFVALPLLSWLPFLAIGYDPLDSLFEVVSACATAGLSTGIVRPELEASLKAVLCFDMLAGRVEIIALLVVLRPANWLGRRERSE
ncbi:MAG: TrkH family potassium uptake protein [Burkholderiales bacterium]|nr:MAG: TrkH family potassium uptake protein [Burkholderiales bacterium]